MIAILRREDGPMESTQLRERSQDIAGEIRDRIIKYTRGVAKGSADLIPVHELIRMEHVMLSITRLAKVVADYSEIKLKVMTESEFHLENLIPVHPLVWRLSAWIKESLYPADTTWFERLWFPVRLTASLTIAPTTRISMAAVRMLYTVIGLTATLMLSLLTVPVFICRELSCRTADEIRSLGEVVVHGITALTASAEAGSSPRCSSADLGSVVSTGNLILQRETARAAATSGAEEENTLLRLVSVNASRCQISAGRIISAQRQVMRVSRCSMSVCISLECCMHSIGATARKHLLLPARETLDGVATAMLKSSIELEALLRGRSAAARVIEATEELVRAMGVALTHFEDLHRELLFSKTWAIDGDVMDSTKLVEALSSGGGVGLHEGLYALTSFVAEWLALVNAFLGCSITVSPPREHETRMKRFVKTTTSARARSRAYSEQLGAGKLDE
ncbi:hypothetical protein FOZ63_003898 [Perkinsus olseni]|uniref:Uncharacterized protein n=1 Tax=Perkinsus olseni TaxID=32597 RepID=A0A7J6UIZ8_PEROL|nr:hypothetical protein FOZ63_003898 [Perkinsus olseni]